MSKCNEHFRITHQKYRKEIQEALQKQKKRLEAQGVDTTGFIESRSKVPVWRVDIDAIEHDTPISLDLATFLGGDTIHSAKNQEWFTIDNHSYIYAFLQPPHGLRPPLSGRLSSLGDFQKRTRHGPKLGPTWGNPYGDFFSVEKEAENGQKPFDGKSWEIAHYRRAQNEAHRAVEKTD